MVEAISEDITMKATASVAGRLGALRRNSIYGNPGTLEGRFKGGLTSYLKFKSNPELAYRKGFKLEREIVLPQKSALLAEFLGIVLGDGSISDYQLRIYFNAKTDNLYASFVGNMSLDLFGMSGKIALRPKNTLELTLSSGGLVKFLVGLGLEKGNKVDHGVDIPKWIIDNEEYAKACLRGLMDTDGGVYFHTHKTKGIKYRNIALCFTNRSKPLLNSVEAILLSLGINTKSDSRERVFVYNKIGIDRYMYIVGTHNINFRNRFESHKGTKV